MQPAPLTRSEAPRSPSVVVGIGASAGGLVACKQLLEAMPTETGMAFVVVFHLDPSHLSHLAELLQNVTGMPVVQVGASLTVEPDHVYVIAPNTELALRGGVLECREQSARPRGAPRPIDAFFNSLAADRMETAVAVVLSGTGNDGAAGCQEVKRWGGLCLAQRPDSAEHAEMPRHAIETGAVDHQLAPADMPDLLVRHASLQRETEPSAEAAEGPERSGFDTILQLMGRRYGLDLRAYKRGTLERRASRRMSVLDIQEWSRYRDYLHEHPEEADLLYHDVLIGVTSFFRELDAWKDLAEHVVPELLRGRDPDAPLRAWIVGCATGEEAYSLAIVLLSEVERAGLHAKVQVYATNVNAAALGTARSGVYPASIENDVPPEHLARWFEKEGEQYHVTGQLREAVTFAAHNVLSDPPFSKLDLVSCRNLLIYFTPPAQDRVLELFHFALRPGGILFLGRWESVGRHAALFETVSKRWRIFRSTTAVHPGVGRLPYWGQDQVLARGPQPALPGAALKRSEAARRVELAVLARHTAACVAITQGGEIVYFFGPTQDYLSQPTGEARLDLLSWARPGMYSKLRSALEVAVQERRLVRIEEMFVERAGVMYAVECTIEPLAQGLFLVVFRDRPQPMAAAAEAVTGEGAVVQQLADELKRTQQELQRATDQLDRTDEDHRIGHEELLSLNEELQSSNEELETSKEELQSLNEEMNTINRQLEERNSQLRTVNANLQNLLASTDVPTIFLDRDFRITFFTPAATGLMRLIPSDVGRPIGDIKERFRDERLLGDARSVLDRLTPVSAEVPTEDGRWYVRRILPYRSDDDRIDGVCLTFSDVTAQKLASQDAHEARHYAEGIIRTIDTPLLVLNGGMRVQSANQAFLDTFQVAAEDTLGRTIYDLGNRQWNIPRLRELLEYVLPESKEVKNYEVEHVFERLGRRSMRVNARVLDSAKGEPQILVSIDDVTEWRNLEAAARAHADVVDEEQRRKDHFLAMLGHELRNPLAALMHGLELLRQLPSGPVTEETRQMMWRQAARIGSMLDQLLDIARVITGKIEIVQEPVDLLQIVRTALEAVEPLIADRVQQLTTALPPAGSVRVLGDALRLTQVVENLLLNASKYTDPRGKIWLSVLADAERAVIRVRDSGVGIEPDLLPRVFDPFTQAPGSLGRAPGGLGLGLALVRNLVELHGGEVHASSGGAGQGSEFVVTLPRLREEPAAIAGPTSPPSEAGQVPRRVLLVDDERDVAQSLARLLVLYGHRTLAVHSAEAALEAARAYAPDAVLVDIGLPDMDGFELARRLRADYAGRPLQLLALTGYGPNAGRFDAAAFDAAGFDAHLIKPVSVESLQRLLSAPPVRRVIPP